MVSFWTFYFQVLSFLKWASSCPTEPVVFTGKQTPWKLQGCFSVSDRCSLLCVWGFLDARYCFKLQFLKSKLSSGDHEELSEVPSTKNILFKYTYVNKKLQDKLNLYFGIIFSCPIFPKGSLRLPSLWESILPLFLPNRFSPSFSDETCEVFSKSESLLGILSRSPQCHRQSEREPTPKARTLALTHIPLTLENWLTLRAKRILTNSVYSFPYKLFSTIPPPPNFSLAIPSSKILPVFRQDKMGKQAQEEEWGVQSSCALSLKMILFWNRNDSDLLHPGLEAYFSLS